MIRVRAIFCCLYFSVVPWQFYERESHYQGMTYWEHLIMNLRYIFVWVFYQENQEDLEFEKKTNSSWVTVWQRSNRWTQFRKSNSE